MRKIDALLYTFFLLIVSGCSGNITEPGSELPDFEITWQTADRSYTHFELKGIDWDEVYQRLLPRAQQAKGDEIIPVLFDLLAELKDPHVWFRSGGKTVNPYQSFRSERDEGAFSLDVVERVITGSVRSEADGRIRFGMFAGNIGYIYLSVFSDKVGTGFSTALTSVQSTNGLIIDVRANEGGALDVLTAIAGRFTTTAFTGIPTSLLGAPLASPRVVPTGEFRYTKPTVVLINGTTFSAGESFTEVMKQIPSVTAIGDTTAGGGGGFTPEEPGIIEMPSGRRAAIPTAELRRYDGMPMEWLGVPPDIRIAQTMVDIENSIDKQLKFAVEFLKSND